MRRAEPLHYLWWLVSRASGIIALLLISLSVLMGLAMATKILRRPGLKRGAARMHELVALIALVAIGLHGASLLGDHWLKPGVRGIALPFAMSYRPQFTGVGIIAGYLALLLGPSFYLRRRIGARRWRKLHRMTALAWLLSVLHTLGAGSDGSKLWLRVIVFVPCVPIVYLLVLRLLQPSPRTSSPTRTEKPHSAIAPTLSARTGTTAEITPASDTLNSKNPRLRESPSAASIRSAVT